MNALIRSKHFYMDLNLYDATMFIGRQESKVVVSVDRDSARQVQLLKTCSGLGVRATYMCISSASVHIYDPIYMVRRL